MEQEDVPIGCGEHQSLVTGNLQDINFTFSLGFPKTLLRLVGLEGVLSVFMSASSICLFLSLTHTTSALPWLEPVKLLASIRSMQLSSRLELLLA